MKKFALALVSILLVAHAAQAQDRIHVSAAIETSMNSVGTSWNSPQPGIILNSTQWTAPEQTMKISATPVNKLSVAVKFTVGSSAQNPPRSIDTLTGLEYRPDNSLQEYGGSINHVEITGSYRVLPHLDVVGGYMKYSLKNSYQNMHQTSFDGSGFITDYNETQTYKGFEVGARSHFQFEKLGVEPEFLFYPSIDRHFSSHQDYLGEVFDNDMDMNEGRRFGLQASGRMSYRLVRNLDATFAYSYQLIRSEGSPFAGPAPEHLTTKSAVVGVRVGF